MTATDVEAESIEHLDFDHQPPCEVKDCDRSATHSIRCRSCETGGLSCTTCVERATAWAAQQLGIYCADCHRFGPRLLDVFHIHPLH